MPIRRGQHGSHRSIRAPVRAATCWLIIAALLISGGCTRKHYRRSADEDAYSAIKEKTAPPWPLVDYTIDPKPESRFFDPDNPDFPPMPPDDPGGAQDDALHRRHVRRRVLALRRRHAVRREPGVDELPADQRGRSGRDRFTELGAVGAH